VPFLERLEEDADVLVVGGGLAGCMAAIRARELGARVIVAEKADTLRSGCAGMGVDHCWTYIPEVHRSELSIEDLVKDHTAHAGGFLDQEIATFIANHSLERLLDLERFGVPIRDERGRFRLIKKVHRVPTFLHFAGRDLKVRLTQQMVRCGVRIVNRVMVTDLLTRDNQVVGAVGIGTRAADLMVFRAKTVILATGNIYRLYLNRSGLAFNISFPPHETGDGHGMAFRAGAELLNMEFTTFQTGPKNFQRCGRGTFVPGRVVDAWGQPVGETSPHGGDRVTMDPAVESEHAFEKALREGRGPIYMDCREATEEDVEVIRWGLNNEGNAALLTYMDEQGLDLRRDKLEFEIYEPKGGSGKAGIGINSRCETSVGGLYAAGDVIGGVTRAVAPGAFTLGWHAGEVAACAARERDPACLDEANEQTVAERRDLCRAILSRSRGAPWKEGQAALQSLMDYYVGRVRSATMLGAGLVRLARLHREAPAELAASGPHELQRCLEVLSLVDAGEAVARSARFREESRFGPEHYRADFPYTDNENWFCNTAQRRQDGDVRVYKKPIRHIYR
jgi:succinate dehydrogenase/fumarate reductase flavoprotein subunit